MISLFVSTILFRWYVFFFWGVGLWALTRATGFPGALLRFAGGYGIAYLCEWSSSRADGWFPFGHYRYLPTTMDREIWIGPLPLMDSMSFDFLAVGALGLAGMAAGHSLGTVLGLPWRAFLPVAFRGVILFVMIDMMIDPVSLRGARWFLGQIYDYPTGGAYFGVTLSNFAGWGVVGALMMALWRVFPPLGPVRNMAYDRGSPSGTQEGVIQRILARWAPAAIYLSVALFNLSVAVYLGEWKIVGADLAVGVLGFFLLRFPGKISAW